MPSRMFDVCRQWRYYIYNIHIQLYVYAASGSLGIRFIKLYEALSKAKQLRFRLGKGLGTL